MNQQVQQVVAGTICNGYPSFSDHIKSIAEFDVELAYHLGRQNRWFWM